MATRYPGLRFEPTDEQLFYHYLLPRLNRDPLPDPDAVRDCDMYGGGNPWEIFDKDRSEKFYVFTMLKKKNKSRVDRIAGSGTWKGEQSHEIRNSLGELVGYKKLFTFKQKADSSAKADKTENGHWIMYEYSTHPHKDTECVLCVIHNKYADKGNEKACRNLHGRVQLEEENRRAKKTLPLCDDHTNASAASPPSSAAAQARPLASPALNKYEVVIPHNICGPTSLDFAGNANLSSHPAVAAMTTAPKDIRCTADFPASGGTNACPLSTTGTAAPMVDREWADQLKNMEFSPLVKHLLFKNFMERARALHARNDLRVEFQPFCRPPGRVPANYQKN